MNIEEDILIEQFLRSKLSKKEHEEVLERINSDSNFKEKVLFEKQLLETLDQNNWCFVENTNNFSLKEYEDLFRSNEVKSIKKAIKNANKNYKKKRKSTLKKWYIYSSVAVIALLFSIYTFNLNNFNSEEVYSKYINNTELPSFINRSNESQLSKLQIGQKYFDNKDYKSALDIFSKELKSTPNNSNIYLYNAVSQINLNQFKEAENTLNLLIKTDLLDAEKAYWFKSLLYIKSKQNDKAKHVLEMIIKNNYYKKNEARELLKQIK